MKLSDKTYSIIKWITLIALPALTALYAVIASACGLPYSDEVAKISAGVCTCLGSLIGISTAEYNRSEEDEDN